MLIKSKFQRRLMLYAFILYMTAIPLTGFLSYIISRDVIYNEVEKVNNHMAKEAAVSMDMILDDMLDALNTLSRDKRLQGYAASLGEEPFSEYIARREISTQFHNMLDSYELIDTICIISPNDVFFVSATIPSTNAVRNEMEAAVDALREKIMADSERHLLTSGTYYTDIDGKIVLYKRLISDNADTLYLAIEIKKAINQSPRVLGPYVYVYGDALIVNMGYGITLDEQFRRVIAAEHTLTNGDKAIEIGKGFLRITKALSTGALQLAYFVDISAIQPEINRIRDYILLASIVSFVFIMLLSPGLTSRLYKNVMLIKKNMSEADYSDFEKLERFPIESDTRKKRNRLPFMTKTLMYFSATAAIPIFVISCIAYTQTLIIIQDRIGNEIKNNVGYLSDKLNYTLAGYSTSGFMLSINRTFQELLEKKGNGTLNATEKLMLVDMLINEQLRKNNMDNIYVYNNRYQLFYSLAFSADPNVDKQVTMDFDFLNNNTPDKKWETDLMNRFDHRFIRVGIRIRNIATFEPLGYLFVEFDGGPLKMMLNSFSSETNTYIAIYDQTHRLLYMEDMPPDVMEDIDTLFMQAPAIGPTYTSNGGEDYFITTAEIETVDWKIIAITPMSYYTRNNGRILVNNLIILLCCMVMVLLASYNFSLIITRSAALIRDRFLKMQNGVFQPVNITHPRDEIEELGMHYNIMLERIQSLINEVYVTKLEMADTELKLRESRFNALQSQINPHFLYNTLETIHYMIILEDKNAIKMVQLLGDLFRNGIGKGEKFVQVKQELEHIRLYIGIQQLRYPDKFTVEIDVDEQISVLFTIKFLLQPILENTIYHGLELMESDGKVWIVGLLKDDRLIIRITDNGKGMNSDTLNELAAKLDGRVESKSIGLKNVHERIQLYFGTTFGLKINSEYGIGTEVEITLPVLSDNPE